MFKYYLIGSMADADFLPADGLVSCRLYGSKPFFRGIGCRVCGEAVYDRLLSEKDIAGCHLILAKGGGGCGNDSAGGVCA